MQKEQHAKQRGSWYGISPVTRTVPNGKAYDRNRVKREDRELTESAPVQSSRRTGSAYRREMRIRKNDALMRIVIRRYVPHAGYIDYGFGGNTLLHSGKYIKYPKNSNCQRWMKRETSRKFRNCQDLPRKGNYYRRLFDYWWTLY